MYCCLLPRANEVAEGIVFTGVCLSTRWGGVSLVPCPFQGVGRSVSGVGMSREVGMSRGRVCSALQVSSTE